MLPESVASSCKPNSEHSSVSPIVEYARTTNTSTRCLTFSS